MSDEKRIQQLLEEILDSNSTPEECCSRDPELLVEVRARWERIRRVEYQIDELFPSSSETPDNQEKTPDSDFKLPRIPGYDVESVLGRGGMGVVFKARHHKLNRFVALKMLLAGAYAGQQELKRFRLEAESAAALRHPNIVQVHDVGDLSGPPYMTLELIEGVSLAQRLGRQPQSIRYAAELVAQIAGAVQFAHQSGIIHRDLKPGNILLTADGIPKIADFGLARSIARGRDFTLTGARIGTPNYMAPEQALGKVGDIGPSVDIYALGAILYEMLTGRPPFIADSIAEIERKVIGEEVPHPTRFNPKIPPDLETICLKCLQKNPARRYASAQDLADDLHRFLDGKPVLARPVSNIERMLKWARRRPALAILVSGAILAIVIGTVTAIWLH
jgi:serine/threonine protein kinase